MVQINDVQALIRKHEYEVSLKIMEDGEITASFPDRQEKPFCEPFNNVYKIEKKGVLCQIDDLKEFIEAPRYALRSLVFADVLRVCDIIGYDSKLLALYINDIEKSYQDFYKHMLSFKLNSGQMQQDNDLEKLMKKGRLLGFSQKLKEIAREQKIERGFEIIKNILTGSES